MKKPVFILTLLLFCFLTSCKSTNMSETLQISDCELHSEYTTVYYIPLFITVNQSKLKSVTTVFYLSVFHPKQNLMKILPCSILCLSMMQTTFDIDAMKTSPFIPKTTQKAIQFVKLFLMVMSFLKSSTRVKILLLVILKSL